MLPRILTVVADWRGANDGSYAAAFKELGCPVKKLDVSNYFSHYSFAEKVYKRLTAKPFPVRIKKFNEDIIKAVEAFQPQLLFIAKGLWVQPETLRYAQSKEVFTIHWHPDDAFNPENTSAFLNHAIPVYDMMVTPKTFNASEYKAAGAKKVIYLPYSYDPHIHYPAALSAEERENYKGDIAFVGAMRKKRIYELEYLYKEGLELRIWGTGWHKLPKHLAIEKACEGRPVYAEEMSKAFQASTIVLGFLNEENRDRHTARTFEVPACRGFFLAERTEEHQEFFREGIEADYFSSIEEMKEKCRFYIQHKDLAKQIAERGYKRVLALQATYKDRAAVLLKEIEG